MPNPSSALRILGPGEETPGGVNCRRADSHSADALVQARVVRQRGDLCVRELGVFLNSSQLIDLEVGQLHLLLCVNHLQLELREGLQRQEVSLCSKSKRKARECQNFTKSLIYMLTMT